MQTTKQDPCQFLKSRRIQPKFSPLPIVCVCLRSPKSPDLVFFTKCWACVGGDLNVGLWVVSERKSENEWCILLEESTQNQYYADLSALNQRRFLAIALPR